MEWDCEETKQNKNSAYFGKKKKKYKWFHHFHFLIMYFLSDNFG